MKKTESCPFCSSRLVNKPLYEHLKVCPRAQANKNVRDTLLQFKQHVDKLLQADDYADVALYPDGNGGLFLGDNVREVSTDALIATIHALKAEVQRRIDRVQEAIK